MSGFGNRSLPGDTTFEVITPAGREQPGARGPAASRPVPDIGAVNGSAPPVPAPQPTFHSLSEHEFDVVAVISAEGRFIFVSASAERLFGYDIGDVVGLDAFALFDSASVASVRALFDDLVARRRLSVSLEMSTVRADGTPIDLDVSAANHLDDPIGGVVVNIRDITEQHRLQERLREVARRESTIVESLADGVLMVDSAGAIVGVNEAFEVMFEAPRVRLIGRRLEDVVDRAPANGFQLVDGEGEPVVAHEHPVMAGLRPGRRMVGVVFGMRRPEGSMLWVRVNAQAMVGSDGEATGAVLSFSDITSLRRSAADLHREEQFLQVLLDTLEEGIVACDAEGRITVFNPSARRLHGLVEESDPIGRIPTDQGLRRSDGSPMGQRENPLIRAMSGEHVRDVEIVLEAGNGERRKVSVNGQALVDDAGLMLGAVVAMHDVTEQKLNEERLAELALHDPLTGLANRTLLAERMREAIEGLAQLAAAGQSSEAGIQPGVAVYLLDLDEFKEINDELGHDVGDDMLVAVARRLLAIVRPSDTVARLGGDEFVVVCAIENGEEEMLAIADRISTALARPYRIDGRTLRAVASVGGVFADNPDTDPSKLLSRADDAMYGVKWSRRRERRSMTD